MPELDIDIFDAIGGGFFDEGITAKGVSRLLAQNPDADSLRVRINSPGGDVFEGNAIYSLLRGSGLPVKVEVHGLAASMASVIATAGDEVAMAENALFMVHNPWGFAVGGADDMRETADVLDKIKATLLTVYARKSGKDKAELSKIMDAETWYSAKEAQEAGFIDSVTQGFSDTKEVSTDAKARFQQAFAKFTLAPAALAAAYRPEPKAKRMDLEKILAMLGLPSDANETDVRGRVEALQAPQDAKASLGDFVPRADFDNAMSRLAEANSKIEALAKLETQRFEAQAVSAVDSAVAAGKIPPASKDYHLKIARQSPEALAEFQAYVGAQPAIVGTSQMEKAEKRAESNDGSSLTVSERSMCATLGVSEEEFLAEKKQARNVGVASYMYGN